MRPERHLLVTTDTAARLRRRHRTLVIPGVSQGGPPHLLGTVRELLIEAEQEGLHTVVLAAQLADLEAPPALVCRFVATDRDEVEREAASRYGSDRVLRVRSARVAERSEWVGRLPRPEARTLRRRIRRTARRFGPARALHAMIAGRRRRERRTR